MEGGKENSSGIRYIRKEAKQKIAYCHSAHGIVSVDEGWRLRVASNFGRKTRRLSDDVVPRGEPGTRGGREETVTGTGTRAETNEDEGGNGHEDRDRDWNGSGKGNENGAGGVEERVPGNLRSDSRGGSEYTRGGARPTSN